MKRQLTMATYMFRRPSSDAFNGDVVPLRAMMNQLIENAFTPTGWSWGNTASTFAWDVHEDENAYYIQAYLPGVDPNAVSVTVHDNVLTLSGETKPATPEGWRPLVREFSYGQFERQITLGAPVETAKAEAAYQNG